jgi:hypothetical protein
MGRCSLTFTTNESFSKSSTSIALPSRLRFLTQEPASSLPPIRLSEGGVKARRVVVDASERGRSSRLNINIALRY